MDDITSNFQVSDEDYLTLAAFRAALRKFMRTSEDIAHSLGLTPQQHQVMLAVRGYPGQEQPSMGQLAARLQVRHNSAVGLVTRLVKLGYVRRDQSSQDQRRVHISLTPKGHAILDKLTEAHRTELKRIGPEITRLLKELTR
ncbi:MAG TPA: MarR family transcriptional regulator [Gammaproteobacteria bacterium]|jgi:DNA-binding MarR family transcriptional regulator|nr:MarR family transcriptional regulator [Gammaproteobacteria bacterium]